MAIYKNKEQRDFRLVTDSSAASPSVDFSQIKIGNTNLKGEIATLIRNYYNTVSSRGFDRDKIMRAMSRHDIREMRRISNMFFETSGIYSRLCRYMAYLYRYD